MKFKNLYEELFFKALRIRLTEEKIIEIYPTDKIQSPVHLSIGQEAVAVGVCQSLKITDLLFCNYRSHAFYLAKGGDINEMFAELYGKVTGCGRGKAGSMHLFSKKVGLPVTSAVVASTISHAVGAALAEKRKKTTHVAVSVFGDGATEEGVFHECLNFASLHKLPVIFVCENNGLAVHSRLNARHAYEIPDLGKLYHIPVTVIEKGYDPVHIHEAFSAIVQKVRQERTPQFVEIKTCRYKEHVGPGDDFRFGYRGAEEVDSWKAKDPLILDQKLAAMFRPDISNEIEKAAKFADDSPWPDPEELMMHV